ncbi:MAG: nucleotidyl transferase AbiEii/AbiGii toxin family protein [Acidobacteriota bacterium]
MQDLIQQERFELEVLDRMNSARLLSGLVFGGGTMLRLCFGLDRFSVDLDFWIVKEIDSKALFNDLKKFLSEYYSVRDAASKFYTMLFEIRSGNFRRSLKIEIRKEKKKVSMEKAIAYSRYSTVQVLLNVVSLKDMMESKIEAFLTRKEIRDVFDVEFLYRRGIPLSTPASNLKKMLIEIKALKKRDYTVKLGSIIEDDQRQYYVKENFKILKQAIAEKF